MKLSFKCIGWLHVGLFLVGCSFVYDGKFVSVPFRNFVKQRKEQNSIRLPTDEELAEERNGESFNLTHVPPYCPALPPPTSGKWENVSEHCTPYSMDISVPCKTNDISCRNFFDVRYDPFLLEDGLAKNIFLQSSRLSLSQEFVPKCGGRYDVKELISAFQNICVCFFGDSITVNNQGAAFLYETLSRHNVSIKDQGPLLV